MKIISCTFTFRDGSAATAQACFATLPGEGDVRWIGEPAQLFAHLAECYREPVVLAYVGTFEGWMRKLAQDASADLVVRSEGDWEIFEE